VVNTLAEELKKRDFKINNDRNKDLYIMTSNRKIRTIFEIKIDTLNDSLYSAKGRYKAILIEKENYLLTLL